MNGQRNAEQLAHDHAYAFGYLSKTVELYLRGRASRDSLIDAVARAEAVWDGLHDPRADTNETS